MHDWIENWLINKKQRDAINGIASDWAPVTNGVPQDSVFFIIYINYINLGHNNYIAIIPNHTKIGNSKIFDQHSLKSGRRSLSTLTNAILFNREKKKKK